MMLIPSTWLLLCCAAFAVTWPQQQYKTVNFSVPDMKITRSGSTEPGYLFFGTVESEYKSQMPLIMSDDNELVWGGTIDVSPHNFKVQTLEDKPVLTYFTGAQDHFGHGYGKVIILNNAYETIKTVCLRNTPELNFVTPIPHSFPGDHKDPCYIDYHESYITDQGTILVTAFNVTHYDLREFGGPKNGWIFDWLFFELDTSGNVLFKWSALDHVDPKESNYRNQRDGSLKFGGYNFGEKQSEPWDFFHGNSVSPVPGGYLINSRMTWSVYKIQAGSGTVEWTLEGSNGGDFKLKHPVPFWSWQHMPRLAYHTYSPEKFQIHLFNNDNIRGGSLGGQVNGSSGYLLDVDTHSMTVRARRELKDKAAPVYAVAQGSYQALNNNHVLLGYGAAPFIDEYDRHNKLIYRAQFADTSGKISHSYRAYKHSWKGYPKGSPVVVSERGHIYASWNGATEYDAWNIYAGDDKKNMKLAAKNIPKSGFETHHRLNSRGRKYKYIMAEALKGGQVASRSSPVRGK